MTIRRSAPVSLALLAMLGGCSLTAPSTRVDLPLPPERHDAAPSAIAPQAGTAQSFDFATPVSATWWKEFASPELDALVDRALAANNDLATADAALRQARELAAAAGGSLLPALDAGYQAQRAKIPAVISPPLADPAVTLYTLHTGQLSVTYPLDVFGGGRAKVRSARAAAEVQAFRYQAARTSIIANLVQAVIQHAALQAQIAAAQQSLDANRAILAMTRKRQEIGYLGKADVAAQEAALAAAEGVVPPLERARQHQEAIIAALIGQAPGATLPPLPGLDKLILPAHLPATIPSRLVTQRPDVRASEAQMRGAAADLGSAIAARLPAIQLSAAFGGTSTDLGTLFASDNLFWTLLGSITQPLFHGGALRHQQHAAEAALDGAKSQYRATVLQSFVDVSDALSGLQADGIALDAAARADRAADESLGYQKRQLELGAAGTFALLQAEAARAQASATLIQAQAARLSDTVALYQALGGGTLVN